MSWVRGTEHRGVRSDVDQTRREGEYRGEEETGGQIHVKSSTVQDQEITRASEIKRANQSQLESSPIYSRARGSAV